MRLLKGEFFHTLDSKSRVTIPAKVRDAIDPERDGAAFVAVPSYDDVLYLYPSKVYDRLAPEPEPDSENEEAVREFLRLSYGVAEDLEVDSLGRVLLSENLVRRCGLGRDVAIVGVRDHVEVWDRGRWQHYVGELLRRKNDLGGKARPYLRSRAAAAPRTAEPSDMPPPAEQE